MFSPRLPLVLLATTVLAGSVVAGCGGTESSDSGAESELTAVATTTQVGDFVRQVGGERVDVEQILQPNSDPHGYEPRPSDAAALAEAAVVFSSGGEVDEWLGDLIESAGGEATQVELIDFVETRTGEGHDHGHEEHGEEHAGEDEHSGEDHSETEDEDAEIDPHWWQDPHNAELAVAAIRDALVEADPDGAETYRRNAAAYLDRLDRLDRATAACIERIPAPQRKLVTSHDALGYYADRYDIDIVGALIPSLSTQGQPSAKDTQQLVDQIEQTGVKAIFPESSVNPKLEQAIARETGATVGEPLWADALGPEGSSGATYSESIASNTESIVEGLTGGARHCRPRP